MIDELLADNALFRLRAAQGVLGLADKHDPARLEAACAKATAAGDPSYRTIKGILAAGTETDPRPADRRRRRRRAPARALAAVRATSSPCPVRATAHRGHCHRERCHPGPGHDEPPVHDEGGRRERADPTSSPGRPRPRPARPSRHANDEEAS